MAADTPTPYAGSPGCGPKGETCGSCRFFEHFWRYDTIPICGQQGITWDGEHIVPIDADMAACVCWEVKAAPCD